MQVKVTVSRPGGKTGDSFSQSITLKDAQTITEVQQRIVQEFGKLFPQYASLEEPEKTRGKKQPKEKDE